MQFILTGFTQDLGVRVFAFEGRGTARIRSEYTVAADLAAVRRYGIRVQELPLLCRSLLDGLNEAEENRSLTFTEDQMRVHANNRAAERETAAQKKKSHRDAGTADVRTAG